MMRERHWTDRLSEYVDGAMSVSDRASCEAHLEECAACLETVEGLRALTKRASRLGDIPPSRDLWPGIESRLQPRPLATDPARTEARHAVPLKSKRRVEMTVRQLMAAVIVLVLFSAGGMWVIITGGERPLPTPETGRAEAGPAVAESVTLVAADGAAIRELEAEFEARREELDPETVRVVEENLTMIDAAITEALRALAEDPSSAYLGAHLASSLRRKADLLRRVATLQQTQT